MMLKLVYALFPALIFSAQLTNRVPNIGLQPLWTSLDRTSNYHGKFGTVGVAGVDPAFEPYSSFIFESALYRTDQWYEDYLIPYVSGDSRHYLERFLRERN